MISALSFAFFLSDVNDFKASLWIKFGSILFKFFVCVSTSDCVSATLTVFLKVWYSNVFSYASIHSCERGTLVAHNSSNCDLMLYIRSPLCCVEKRKPLYIPGPDLTVPALTRDRQVFAIYSAGYKSLRRHYFFSSIDEFSSRFWYSCTGRCCSSCYVKHY